MTGSERGVVVTGAGGGIGTAIALAFARDGAGVVCADLGEAAERGADAVRRGGGKAVAQVTDVTRTRDTAAMAERALAEFGRLDVLVACAGIDGSGLLSEQDEATWTHVVDVNLNGTYRAIRACLPAMLDRRAGRIVTISSVLGKMGGYGFVTAYAASKHGVIGLTRSLAAELGSQGYPEITVNAVCPGYVRAGMGVAIQNTKAGPRPGEEIFDRYYRRLVPARRMMEADEIAAAVLFLASPSAAGITGQALNVDGGFFMS